MKTSFFFPFAAALAAFLFHALPGQAKIWRVNKNSNYNTITFQYGENVGGTSSYPVFAEINQAVEWASVNMNAPQGIFDTLHIEGATGIYNNATITKRLTIIGPGYFLSNNPKTGNNGLDAKIGSINFNAGSGGSVLIGMTVGNAFPYNININVNDIIIKRCRILYEVNIGSGLQSVTIVQNYFDNTATTTALELQFPYVEPSDLIFNNNIVKKTLLWHSAQGDNWPITQCRNNTFDPPPNSGTVLKFSSPDFSNNILLVPSGLVDTSGLAMSYNIAPQATQFGNTNNNRVVPAIATLVTGGTSRLFDGNYQIVPGSNAYQNGSDGTDRGAFGGALLQSRYTLSGLAPVPVVYEATTTGVVSPGGLPVTIKARTVK